MIADLVCPVRGSQCRHAGHNFQVIKRERVRKIGDITIPDGIVTVIEESEGGIFCNDLGVYVETVKQCPHKYKGQQRILRWVQ